MMIEISASLTGDAEVLKMFMRLEQAVQVKILEPLIKRGSKMLDDAVIAEAPVYSGLMIQAIGSSQLKRYTGGTIFITTGVRRGFKRAVTSGSRGKLRVRGKAFTAANPDAAMSDPTKYLHLVEGGRKEINAGQNALYDSRTNRFFGRHVAEAKANPFMERSFDRAKDAVVTMITSEAEALIVAEASNS